MLGIDVPWTKMIKPELTHFDQGKLVLGQTPEDIHKNHLNDMHAGVIFTMVEMAGMGVVVMTLGEAANTAFVVVKNVSIDFIARVSGTAQFHAQLTPAQQEAIQALKPQEKFESVVKVEAFDETENLVCQADVTAFIRLP